MKLAHEKKRLCLRLSMQVSTIQSIFFTLYSSRRCNMNDDSLQYTGWWIWTHELKGQLSREEIKVSMFPPPHTRKPSPIQVTVAITLRLRSSAPYQFKLDFEFRITSSLPFHSSAAKFSVAWRLFGKTRNMLECFYVRRRIRRLVLFLVLLFSDLAMRVTWFSFVGSLCVVR